MPELTPPAPQPAEAEKVPDHVFAVKVKDRANDKEHVLHVTKNSVIDSQAKAEDHVRNMPGSFGGKHPGFDVIADEPDTDKESVPAAIEHSEAQAAADQAARP